MKPGERVLIHAAAGGVGISATQIARNIGAEIFGTASPCKHDAIRAQGVAHAIDYRNQDFEVEAMRITDGEGVDLVIDAIGPTSFRKDYRLLRPGGPAGDVRALGGLDGGRPQHPGGAEEPRQDAAGDGALVEEPLDDEREQRASSASTCSSGGIARAASTGSPSR